MKLLKVFFVASVLASGALHAGKPLVSKPVDQCTNWELTCVLAKNGCNATREFACDLAKKVQASTSKKITVGTVGSLLLAMALFPIKK